MDYYEKSYNIKTLGLTEYENEPVLRFVGKCEKIEDQELLDTVARSLSEGMQTGKEKVKKAEKIKIAKDLVKEGIAVDIILRASVLTAGECSKMNCVKQGSVK